MKCKKGFLFLCILFFIAAGQLFPVPQVRIKDIAYLSGIRENQLSGIGLVTGLAGKGDSQGSELLKGTLANLLSNFGIELSTSDIKSKNCAVVMVSMELPPFIHPGDRVDVTVSSIGDARSLEEGILLQTNLKAANNRVYANAQGKVLVSPSSKSAKTVGTIPGGGFIEREVVSTYEQNGIIRIVLRHPDFVTATAVAEAIKTKFDQIKLETKDAAIIEVTVPEARRDDIVGFIADMESLTLTPDVSGKVVINPNTGVIIIGEKVKIGKVAVSYRDVNVTVNSSYYYTDDENEYPDTFVIEDTATVNDLIDVLRAAGLKADVIIGILQAIQRAGALYGSLIIM
ncbi:MAG: flagellar basal body P-ring protein FlgI [Spirochaetales bacterium]|nr:flagellar basal body P-ring protein FlgI [Spirochaetales bacterium]